MGRQLIRDKKENSQVVGIVPAGSAAELHKSQFEGKNPEVLEKIVIPISSAIASLFPRYNAVIPVNRWGDKIAIGSVIAVERPNDMNIRDYSHQLIDQINYALALQASELVGGVPVEFQRLKAGAGAGTVIVRAVTAN